MTPRRRWGVAIRLAATTAIAAGVALIVVVLAAGMVAARDIGATLVDLASDLPGVLPPVLGVVGGASLPVGLAFAGWFERPGSKRAAIVAFAMGSAIATVLVAIGLEHRERGLRLFDPAVFYGGIGAAVFVAAAVSAAMWARRGLGDPSVPEVTTDP